jgi:hypothetical protein
VIDRDDLTSFLEQHKLPVLVGSASFLFVLLLVLFLGLFGGHPRQESSATSRPVDKAAQISPDELWLPVEPYPVPGLQLFRRNYGNADVPGIQSLSSHWSSGEAKKWYTVSDEMSLELLRKAVKKQIDDLLESVP